MAAGSSATSATHQPPTHTAETKEGKFEMQDAMEPIKFLDTIRPMAMTGPLNILLVCMPIAIISYGAQWPDAFTFIFSLLALAPLAERLGFVTEQLALHTNDTIGGLLNATFGNATELIVAITALKRGLYRLVQLSFLGSILSNMLLVLGCSFLAGGYYHKTQVYGTISSQMNSTLLMIASMGIAFPTILSATSEESHLSELGYSRATSIILFLLYFAFLYFQLASHKHLYEEEGTSPHPSGGAPVYAPIGPHAPLPETIGEHPTDEEAGVSLVAHPADRVSANGEGKHEESEQGEGEENDEEEDVLGFTNSLIWLGVITVFIAVLSDAISASIQDAASSLGMSEIFIAAILLPIVGNAAEHAGAVVFATKNKLDLSLGVAIGSSTQIALCVLPLLVIIGWCGGYDLSLNFGSYEAATLLLSVISVTFAIKDGKSNWLLGLTL
eukprot:CAMPEP_0184973052 /NCGR_PEP_ID=MMETSP1098-20130426/4959_1 /TAXON_ID=89044 /ORGANISM="Spumella elongata, Strain CCAP 955/1" /LENGTH=442 /DNA_ID=CAMNT_0027495475 /DNA_START=27 /DNA_END=1352 /DNA_ORIENTATION=-